MLSAVASLATVVKDLVLPSAHSSSGMRPRSSAPAVRDRTISRAQSTLPYDIGYGKALAPTKVKPTVVNAVHAFYRGEEIDTECPDYYNITQHTGTGLRYPSIYAFYASMNETCVCILRFVKRI